MLSLRDLVQSKKTQRDKDWGHLRRLVEADYLSRRDQAGPADILWWLAELRTPAYLMALANERPDLVSRVPTRPWLLSALDQGEEAVARELRQEEEAARTADRAYWAPLVHELRQMRRRLRGRVPRPEDGGP